MEVINKVVARVRALIGDLVGLTCVCGLPVALRWLAKVVFSLPDIVRRGNLQAVDRSMGEGPFVVNHAQTRVPFRVAGNGAFSGIREMYARDVYLRRGALSIGDGDVVVDLGANMGNFTNLALACGSGVRVVAVEPSAALNDAFRASVGLNRGHLERVALIRGFVGGKGAKQDALVAADPEYAGARWVSEEELIRDAELDRIDFLKCDIEGGEFELLVSDSRLLAMTRAIAVEIHAFAGDVEGLVRRLESMGFVELARQRDPDGTSTLLAQRRKETI